MKKEKNKDEYDKDPYRVEATSSFSTCSAMDCTGLIPSLPQSEAELGIISLYHLSGKG